MSTLKSQRLRESPEQTPSTCAIFIFVRLFVMFNVIMESKIEHTGSNEVAAYYLSTWQIRECFITKNTICDVGDIHWNVCLHSCSRSFLRRGNNSYNLWILKTKIRKPRYVEQGECERMSFKYKLRHLMRWNILVIHRAPKNVMGIRRIRSCSYGALWWQNCDF